VDFVSISVALYGLLTFYILTKEELQPRRPLAKFLAIKLIVFATFYQSFVFSILEKTHTIKGTKYWTATNVANGLSALCLTIEMVFFSLFMIWAYPASEYKSEDCGTVPLYRGIIDSFNYSDFAVEIWSSLVFFVRYIARRPGTHGELESDPHSPEEEVMMQRELRDADDTKLEVRSPTKKTFDEAFGLNTNRRKDGRRRLTKIPPATRMSEDTELGPGAGKSRMGSRTEP